LGVHIEGLLHGHVVGTYTFITLRRKYAQVDGSAHLGERERERDIADGMTGEGVVAQAKGLMGILINVHLQSAILNFSFRIY
jgi:hypothetical protein